MANIVIIGTGPAGACLGLLLSRLGHHTTLLESRSDFNREFRGEVLMPSGIEVLNRISPDWRSRVAHREQSEVSAFINRNHIFTATLDDPALRPTAISQPDLLADLVAQAGRFDSFEFLAGARVRELVKNSTGRVTHTRVLHNGEEREFPCDVLIGADGRNSYVRRALNITARETSLPMDVVWFKLPALESQTGFYAYLGRGHLAITYNAWDDQLQLAWIILKGRFGELRSRGVEAWARDLAAHVQPDLANHILANLDHLQKPSLLNSESDCVRHWSKDGALVIGDAAHTVSPVGAQGVNLALRDAYIAANELDNGIKHNAIEQAFKNIEALRMPEIETIQALQAQPPKIVLSQAWWGEPVRRTMATLLKSKFIRNQAARTATPFVTGVTELPKI